MKALGAGQTLRGARAPKKRPGAEENDRKRRARANPARHWQDGGAVPAEEAVGPHAGRMLAIKGRYLFYQDGLEDACRMMPLVDLTSRHLELGHKR